MTFVTMTKTELVPDGSDNINIAPSDRRNVYYFGPTTGSFTLVANTINCQFGDQIILLMRRSSGVLQMNFPTDKFFVTYCGQATESINMVDSPEEDGDVQADNWSMDFYFDGEKFLCTFDTG